MDNGSLHGGRVGWTLTTLACQELFLLQSGVTLSLTAIAALWAPCLPGPLSKEEQPSGVSV